MKTQSHTSDHHLLINTLTKAVLAAMIATSPELLLAAKVTTTPFMTQKPIMHNVIPSKQAPATLVTAPSKSLGQHPQPRVKLPTIRNKPVNKPSPNRSATLGKVNRTLPAETIGSKPAAIQGAEQARQLGATKGALEGLRDISGAPKSSNSIMPITELNKSLFPNKGGRQVFGEPKLPGNKSGQLGGAISFMPKPTTPGSRPANSAGDVLGGAPVTPSGDFAAIMGRARRQDTGDSDGTDAGDSGRTVDHTERRDHAGRHGEHWVTTEVHYSDGSIYIDKRGYNRHEFMFNHWQSRMDPNGTWTSRVSDRDSGYHWGPWSPGVAGNPDPNGGSDDNGVWARWMRKFGGQRFDDSVKTNGDRVNPGPEGATPNPQAPQLLVPTQQLVINPDPENTQGQSTTPDARTPKQVRQQLKDRVKGPGYDGPEISDPFASGSPIGEPGS